MLCRGKDGLRRPAKTAERRRPGRHAVQQRRGRLPPGCQEFSRTHPVSGRDFRATIRVDAGHPHPDVLNTGATGRRARIQGRAHRRLRIIPDTYAVVLSTDGRHGPVVRAFPRFSIGMTSLRPEVGSAPLE